MNVSFNQISENFATINLAFTEEDYKPAVAKKAKEYAKTIQLKGFRPGKVPPALVLKMYGKSLLADVLNELIADNLDGYIKENKLDVLGNPMPPVDEKEIDWDAQKEFDFTFELGLVPTFEVPNLNSLTVQTYKPVPGEAQINEYINTLQTRFAKVDEVDKVEAGDMVHGDLAQPSSNFITNTTMPLSKMHEEVAPLFVGAEKGATITFELEKAYDHSQVHHVTGTKHGEGPENFGGDWTFAISKITRSVPAELNEEFFAKVFKDGETTTEVAFRQRVYDFLVENYQADGNAYTEEAVKQAILDQVSINLPEEFLKRWLMNQKENKLTLEQLESDLPRYLDDLRWTIIRNRVGEASEIKVDYTDVLEETKIKVAQQFGSMGLNLGEEEIEEYAKRFLSQDKGKNVNAQLESAYFNKIMAHITNQVTLQQEELEADAFRTKIEALYAR